MPRKLRVVCPGHAHHVIARGNYRQNVLEQHEDFKQYCYWVKEYQQKYGVDVVSYCLMNNHVHFILVPKEKNGLSRFFNALHMRYSQYKNEKKHKKGHLWHKDPIIRTVGTRKILDQLGGMITWQEYLSKAESSADEVIRTSTHKGYIIGNENFTQQIEKETGIKLTPGKVGRPRK